MSSFDDIKAAALSPSPLESAVFSPIIDAKTPHIIHFSLPDNVTDQQKEAVETARRLHPHWEIKIWDDGNPVENARLAKYLARANSGAQRADLIRLDALYTYGGVYLDSDMVLVKSLDELAAHYHFFIGTEDGWHLTNAQIAAAAQHPAIDAIITFLEENEPDWSLPPNETTGPVLFSRLLGWRPDVTVLPRETFYPYNWNEQTVRHPHRGSYAEHLWAHSWNEVTGGGDTEQRQPTINAKARVKHALRPMLAWSLSSFRRAKTAAESSLNKESPRTFAPLAYGCDSEIVARTAHGHKIVLDGRDLSVAPDVVIRGYHEWPEESFVRRTLRGGDWFVDVGANVGVFTTLAASLCGPMGRVLAFEPNPHVKRLLEKSALVNWFHDRIKIFGVAVGDVEGEAALSYYPERLGDAQLEAQTKGALPFRMTGDLLHAKTVDVPVRRLDDLIPVDLPIKMLKIDAEGHEAKVLGGARRLLAARCFDVIMLEASYELFTRNWKETLASVNMLVELGYFPGTLNHDGDLTRHRTLNDALRVRGSGKTLVFATD